jgi:hypothetical protein
MTVDNHGYAMLTHPNDAECIGDLGCPFIGAYFRTIDKGFNVLRTGYEPGEYTVTINDDGELDREKIGE